MHRSLLAYIAGTMIDSNVNMDAAILLVDNEFCSDPVAAKENADMLVGFDPKHVTAYDRIVIEDIANGFRRLRAKYGIK